MVRNRIDGRAAEEDDAPPPVPKKTFTPIGCLVAVHPYLPKKSHGGVYLPESARDARKVADLQDTIRCLVIAVGPECKWVKPGMEVLNFNPILTPVKHRLVDGTVELTGLIREDHLAGIVDEEFFNGEV